MIFAGERPLLVDSQTGEITNNAPSKTIFFGNASNAQSIATGLLDDVTAKGTLETEFQLRPDSGDMASGITPDIADMLGVYDYSVSGMRSYDLLSLWNNVYQTLADARYQPLGVAAADITDATPDGITMMTAADANPFTDVDKSKLDGIEASADVTDTANVTTAGALMDSELTDEEAVKAIDQYLNVGAAPVFDGANFTGIPQSAVTVIDLTSPAPATPTSPGTAGQVIYAGNYLYICIATDTWLRAQLLTW